MPKDQSTPNLKQDEENIPLDDIPDIGVKWSKKSTIITLIICIIISVLAIFGFLFYQEYKKTGILDVSMPAKVFKSYDKIYSNDSWGFKFSYSPTWSPVIGSVDEGDYFFASQPLNFIGELEPGQAIIEIKPYRDLKSMPFSDWLKYMEENYLPEGKKTDLPPLPLTNYSDERHMIMLNSPTSKLTGFWDMVTIYKGNLRYIFVLETADQATHDQWEGDFKDILNSVELYQGFSS